MTLSGESMVPGVFGIVDLKQQTVETMLGEK
jgi:hypothetical protein